jgi:hypothetical protein
MIRYHGTPLTPERALVKFLPGRHAMVSFATPRQIGPVAEVSHSFVLDNGAFTAWTQGGEVDLEGFAEFVGKWALHPGFDWALIPDVIGGTEEENDQKVDEWHCSTELERSQSVPVWHMHESVDRLVRLGDEYPRVAIGSSGEFHHPGTDGWWMRMSDAMNAVCTPEGLPTFKIHGLRMMDPRIFSLVPFASVDSCGVARKIGLDHRWDHPYLRSVPKESRAQILADRFDHHASAWRWDRDNPRSGDTLFG